MVRHRPGFRLERDQVKMKASDVSMGPYGKGTLVNRHESGLFPRD